MSTAAPNTAIAIRDDQVVFDEHQRKALAHIGVQDASNADLAVFFHTCKRTGLDPFAKQIHMIKRDGKQTIQVGIGGLQLVAQRTTERTKGALAYEDAQWCGPDGVWRDVWLAEEPPAAARVVVLRDGQRFPAVAHFREYVQTHWKNGQQLVTKTWREKPAHMLAKCAEAAALRKAFPQDLSGLYIPEELGEGMPATVQAAPPASEPVVTAADFGVGEPDPAADTVDGELVDDDQAPAETGEQINDEQGRKMSALFNDLGMPDGRSREGRQARLEYVARVLGEPISSSTDLTVAGAAAVIESLIADLDARDQAGAGA